MLAASLLYLSSSCPSVVAAHASCCLPFWLSELPLRLLFGALSLHDSVQKEFRVDFCQTFITKVENLLATWIKLSWRDSDGHDDVERLFAVAGELMESNGAAGRARLCRMPVHTVCTAAADSIDILGCESLMSNTARPRNSKSV